MVVNTTPNAPGDDYSRAKKITSTSKIDLLEAELLHIAPCRCNSRMGSTCPRAARITEEGGILFGKINAVLGLGQWTGWIKPRLVACDVHSFVPSKNKRLRSVQQATAAPGAGTAAAIVVLFRLDHTCSRYWLHGNSGCGNSGGDSMGTTDTESSHVVADQATTREWSQAAPAMLTMTKAGTPMKTASGASDETVTLRRSAAAALRSASADANMLPRKMNRNLSRRVLSLQTKFGTQLSFFIRRTCQCDQFVQPDIAGRRIGSHV